MRKINGLINRLNIRQIDEASEYKENFRYTKFAPRVIHRFGGCLSLARSR